MAEETKEPAKAAAPKSTTAKAAAPKAASTATSSAAAKPAACAFFSSSHISICLFVGSASKKMVLLISDLYPATLHPQSINTISPFFKCWG